MLVKSVQAGGTEASGPPPAEPGYKWVKRPWGWVKVKVEERTAVRREEEKKEEREREKAKRIARKAWRRAKRRAKARVAKMTRVVRADVATGEASPQELKAVKIALEPSVTAELAVKEAEKLLEEEAKRVEKEIEQQLKEAAKQPSLSFDYHELARRAEAVAKARKEYEALLKEREELEKLGAQLKASVESYEKLLEELEKNPSQELYQQAQSVYQSLSAALEEYNKKVEAFNAKAEKLEEYRAAVEGLNELLQEAYSKALETKARLEEALKEARRRIEEENKRLKKLAALTTDELRRLAEEERKRAEKELMRLSGFGEAAEKGRTAVRQGSAKLLETLGEIAGMTGGVELGPVPEGTMTAPPEFVEGYKKQAIKSNVHLLAPGPLRLLAESILNPERIVKGLESVVSGFTLGPLGSALTLSELYSKEYRSKLEELKAAGVPEPLAAQLASQYALGEQEQVLRTLVSTATAALETAGLVKALLAPKEPIVREYVPVPKAKKLEVVEGPEGVVARITETGSAKLVKEYPLPSCEELFRTGTMQKGPVKFAFVEGSGKRAAMLSITEPQGELGGILFEKVTPIGRGADWEAVTYLMGRGKYGAEILSEAQALGEHAKLVAALQRQPLGALSLYQVLEGEPTVETIKVIVPPSKLPLEVSGFAAALGPLGAWRTAVRAEPFAEFKLQKIKVPEVELGELRVPELKLLPLKVPRLETLEFKPLKLPRLEELQLMPFEEELRRVPELRFEEHGRTAVRAPAVTPSPAFKRVVEPSRALLPEASLPSAEAPSVEEAEAPSVEETELPSTSVKEVEAPEEELETPELNLNVAPPQVAELQPVEAAPPAPPTGPQAPPSPPVLPPFTLPWWRRWWLAYLRYLRRLRRMRQAEALTL